jgi:predicted CoA-binding protein
MSFENPGPDAIRALLKRVKTVAVVGFSNKPERPSHNIARQLQRFGYRVIPVRPGISEGLGEEAYPNLAAVPGPIDLVNVFRSPDQVPPIVEECLRLGLKTIWIQEGAASEKAAEKAKAAGMTVVMDRCILRDFTRLCLE